jgi:phosphoenolpyruvate-protein phosphotransferase
MEVVLEPAGSPGLTGRSLSPGLAQGITFVHRDVAVLPSEHYDIEMSQVDGELDRLENAMTTITADLTALTSRVEKEMDAKLASIFEAHQMMLNDATLKEELRNEIRNELVSAGSAVRTVFRRWERRFRSMEAEIAREKGDDVTDLGRRLLSSLAGIGAHALEKLPLGSVLVARRLLPSDTLFLGRRSAAAAILESGGPSSHAALFAREIGLPCVTGIQNATERISSGIMVLVDANCGEVIVDPSDEQVATFQRKLHIHAETGAKAREQARERAVTRDGVAVTVLANVGCREDTLDAMNNGAEGIGLYRIEQIYLMRQIPPLVSDLVTEMRRTLEPAGKAPVCVRLLDIGADKQLPYLQSMKESNPSLGRRGIRFLRYFPDLLHTQLEALSRLACDFDIRVLVPMVTIPEDMEAVRKMFIETAAQCRLPRLPQLGALLETPAAALSASALACSSDFFSIGTNDLTQYTFAADRENSAVDAYFDDAHEVIFRMIKTIHDDAPETPIAVCGELAARHQHVERLLQCGVRILSVAPHLIPTVKQAVRESRVS